MHFIFTILGETYRCKERSCRCIPGVPDFQEILSRLQFSVCEKACGFIMLRLLRFERERVAPAAPDEPARPMSPRCAR